MAISIKQNSKQETVITISGKVDAEAIEQAIKYLRYLELTSGLKPVSLHQVDELSGSIKRSMANKRRKRLAS
ncbi:MAG TPA: hypothetical protein PLV70_03735 [Flavobacteriales bacterium]|nr:hypothetical protein [Flavobacteriales bacterium]HRN35993.1 hypothetical protein [Flavobacteriales bacterium]HRO41124.1 hypothetical protein [Flavobacteriales bacterium]HRP81388.1 hypothetical protein [Flavobacteriales bacterium]HRQ84207.1 hypothetical protein [Flavobacteriales bacterium]